MKARDVPDYVNRCRLCGWPEGQPWLTVNQVAASLAITPRKLREMIQCGTFSQVIKVAHEWRIHHEALDAYIAATQELTGPPEDFFSEDRRLCTSTTSRRDGMCSNGTERSGRS